MSQPPKKPQEQPGPCHEIVETCRACGQPMPVAADKSRLHEGVLGSLVVEVSRLLNIGSEQLALIRQIVDVILEYTAVEAVGIRLRDGDDYPYYVTKGFSREFVKAEGSLWLHDASGNRVVDAQGQAVPGCICGSIIYGRTDPKLPFYTKAGSFWTNSTTQLHNDPQSAYWSHLRGRCNAAGYESMALIPLETDGEIMGLLQLNDRRADRFTVRSIQVLEGLAASIAATLARYRAEQDLARERDFVAAMLDTAEALIMVLDEEGRIVRFNRGCEQTSGFSFTEVYSRYVWDTLVPASEAEDVKTVFMHGRNHAMPSDFEGSWIVKDGSRRLIAWSNAVFIGNAPGKMHTVSVGIDITEQREAEQMAAERQQQLIQSAKLTSLGNLVGGVAHEINNPNNIIMMSTSVLQEMWESFKPILARNCDKTQAELFAMPWPELEENVTSMLTGLEKSAERIKRIVGNLRDYANTDTDTTSEYVDISESIRVITELMYNRIKRTGATFSLQLDDAIPPIIGNPQKVKHALMNVIQNACEAVRQHGKITVVGRVQTQDNTVCVTVCDDGVGIPCELVDEVVDPFFTTRRDAGAMGLGLAIAAATMKEHNGRLHLASTPGEGTAVTLVFPCEETQLEMIQE